MPRAASLARAEREAVRLCIGGLRSEVVPEDVMRAVRRIMPVDAAFIAMADPDTLLFTSAWAEEPLGSATDSFLANEFGAGDVNRFAALAESASHVASLDEATRGARGASERYREIMRPLGLGDELRAALVAGGVCWGYVCLHREDGPTGFGPAESAALARLAPHIAQAIRNTVLLHGSPAPDPTLGPGVVVLAEDLSVVAITSEAKQLLALVDDDRSGQRPLPLAIYAVAAALQNIERGPASPSRLPSARMLTRAGPLLNAHASWLTSRSDTRELVVILEPIEPRAAIPLILSAYGLTAREAAVAKLVLRGHPTNTIADELHISRHTVQDHLKAIFDKTGVRSRRELVGQLLNPHA